ncbi:MAG TPA: shikimate kinase [Terriglobales bacterium]|nr:shikimate kinase [Terriglobales bacterium]
MTQFQRPCAVFLLGFMGAGKSSVGQALARRLGWRFVDLDQRIEVREGRTIAEIFARSGEDAFRVIETAVLRELLAELGRGSPMVVALGGGTPIRGENAALLASCDAPQVFLDAPFEVVRQRCRETAPARPLFQEEEQARLLFESRRPHYLKAQLRVDTASRSAEQTAVYIARALALEPTEKEGG